MTELTHLSLFSGIGGLDLAAEAAGFRTVGQCEWADYPTKVLEKHWPDVPRWRDIRTLTGDDFYARTGRRSVKVISGGFPCQPFSVAGKRRGKEDDRYLWPEMCRVISEIRPDWVIGENVPGIITLALDAVLSDLESQGYACQTFIIPAAGVDAPHRRERICIVGWNHDSKPDGRKSCGAVTGAPEGPDAITGRNGTFSNAKHERCDGRSDNIGRRSVRSWPERFDSEDQPGGNEWKRGACENCSNVADTLRFGSTAGIADTPTGKERQTAESFNDSQNVDYADCGRFAGNNRREQFAQLENGCWWPAEPGLGGVADGLSDRLGGYWPAEPEGIPRIATGIPHRVDQLKGYGNAVVPQQFYPFFRCIAEIERSAV